MKFIVTMTFPEKNGLVKEAEIQHTIPFQLTKLAQFWSHQHGITVDRSINDDNNVKVVTYTVPEDPDLDTQEEFEQHALDNGVDLKDVFNQYRIEIEKLGGTLEYHYVDGSRKIKT